MTEYALMDDCGEFSGRTWTSLAEARKARQDELNQIGQHMGDFLHVVMVTIIREPGAWKIVSDGVTEFRPKQETERVYDLMDHGLLDGDPEWIPDYEWSV